MPRRKTRKLPPRPHANHPNPVRPIVIYNHEGDDVLSIASSVEDENKNIELKKSCISCKRSISIRDSDSDEESFESKKKKTDHESTESSNKSKSLSLLDVVADESAEINEASSSKIHNKDRLPNNRHGDNSYDKQKHESPPKENSQELQKSKDSEHSEQSEEIETEDISVENENIESIPSTSLITEQNAHENESSSNETNDMESCHNEENRQNSDPSRRNFIESAANDYSIVHILILLVLFAFK